MSASEEVVNTWADGFGIWHARIEFPSHGYGNAGEHSLDRHWDRIRAKARRAIRREILARENGPVAPVRIEVAEQGIYPSSGVWYSVEFKERSL